MRGAPALALALVAACGGPTEPTLSQPGYVLSVSIPGVTDTTFQGSSLQWYFISGPDSLLGRRREMILQMLVLDPPPPLQSPLILETHWYHVPTPLPEEEPYDLTGDATGGVYLEARSNVGTWASSAGRIRLSEVADSTLKGVIQATLTQIGVFPKYLPDVELHATFWAPRIPDGSVD